VSLEAAGNSDRKLYSDFMKRGIVSAMAITVASTEIELSPSSTSLSGLDGINFFLSGMLAGFGPFVAVLLADEKWTQQNIGYVLSVGSLAGLLSQVPGGELLDASRSKRFLLALGAIMVAVSALAMALWPIFPVVFAALMLQGLTGGVCCSYKSGPRWPRGSCRKTRTKSTFCLSWSLDSHRTDGGHRLFFLLSGDIPHLGRTIASVTRSDSPRPFI
jgi:MFS family permease